MSDFWEKLNSGQISDEELFRHFIFFEKNAGMADLVGLSDMWEGSSERKKIRDELLRRNLLTEKGVDTLSGVLQEIGKNEFEQKNRRRERF